VSEVAEGVLEESVTGTESNVVVSAPSLAKEGTSVSLPQPAEVVAAPPAASVVDVAERVVGEAGPPSPRPVTAAT
jgi:predicted regulator of Ras-like GTPase activity (Roadblock/LC7/MglB family)